MNLYYGLTNYHLLCSMVHKMLFFSNEEAIFVASEGRLKSRINNLRQSNIFKEVYYIEDKKLRDEFLNKPLTIKEDININIIENIAKKYVLEYEKILPFNIDDYDNLYILADHGALGLYLLMTKKRFIYIEDASGVYSKWKNLDRILEAKDTGMGVMCNYFNAYGKSDLTIDRYVSLKNQLKNCDLTNCKDFDINDLMNRLNTVQLEQIFNIFNFRNYDFPKNNKKNALMLTQRFTTFNLLTRRGKYSFIFFIK